MRRDSLLFHFIYTYSSWKPERDWVITEDGERRVETTDTCEVVSFFFKACVGYLVVLALACLFGAYLGNLFGELAGMIATQTIDFHAAPVVGVTLMVLVAFSTLISGVFLMAGISKTKEKFTKTTLGEVLKAKSEKICKTIVIE